MREGRRGGTREREGGKERKVRGEREGESVEWGLLHVHVHVLNQGFFWTRGGIFQVRKHWPPLSICRMHGVCMLSFVFAPSNIHSGGEDEIVCDMKKHTQHRGCKAQMRVLSSTYTFNS